MGSGKGRGGEGGAGAGEGPTEQWAHPLPMPLADHRFRCLRFPFVVCQMKTRSHTFLATGVCIYLIASHCIGIGVSYDQAQNIQDKDMLDKDMLNTPFATCFFLSHTNGFL